MCTVYNLPNVNVNEILSTTLVRCNSKKRAEVICNLVMELLKLQKFKYTIESQM